MNNTELQMRAFEAQRNKTEDEKWLEYLSELVHKDVLDPHLALQAAYHLGKKANAPK